MPISSRDRLKMMASQTYDPHRIQTAPDLRLGDAHPSVVEVQSYLIRYGYLSPQATASVPAAIPGAVPGQLDAATVRALEEFQRRFNVGTPGILDAPTRAAMSAARCGLPDLVGSVTFNTLCAWNRRNLTYAFGNLSTQVGNDVARNAVRRAFATWAAAGVGLTFSEVAQNQNPDIVIEWRQAADPDHSMVGGVLAHADFPPGCSVIVINPPLPLHYDDQEHTWVDGAVASGFDIETVALHEIGHCLGMLHTNVNGSVMFPSVSPNFTLRILQSDDLEGIRNLYPIPISQPFSQPFAIHNQDGRIELFAIGATTDRALWHRWQTAPNGPFADWHSLGGNVSQPFAIRNQDGRIEVFAIGSDGAVWHRWQTAPNGPFADWHSLGGNVSQPFAIHNQDGRIELFAVGSGGALWHRWQTAPNGPFAEWSQLD
jgi:peptidoglycan hydrolase-like protein with peptidoglycan-binding domain